MTRNPIHAAVALALLLAGCTTAPAREDAPRVTAAIEAAGADGLRLPTPGENYLDADWFAEPMSASYAVQAALLNNPRVRADLARLDAAQAERVQAGLLRNPMASLMALRPEGGGRYELDYSLMQSLFDLFTRSRRIVVADAAQRRVEAEVIADLLALAQDTEAAYYEALAAEARRRVLREQLALEAEDLRLLQGQASQGALPASAVLSQQAAASMQAHELQSAEVATTQARSVLAQLLGLSSAKALVLPEAFPPFDLPGLDEPALQALAVEHRPDLQAAKASVEKSRAERALQPGALRAADPSLGAAGTRESGGLSLNGVAVQISLPIFDTGRARRDLANAQVAQAEFTAESMQRQVPLDVERALAVVMASQAAVEHTVHHVRQQQQLETLARKIYTQGVSDLSTYRLASRARLVAEIERIESQQALWSAFVALERATSVAIPVTDASPTEHDDHH